MFLKNRFADRSCDEQGSALVAVIGILAVASIVTLTIGTVSVGALTLTDSTRVGVQAQAAAESGIDVAAAQIASSTCHASYASSVPPTYSVDVAFSRSSTGDIWYTGCPTAADADRVRLVSSATANGIKEVKAKAEAIYRYVPAPTPPAISASGAAMYSYSDTSLSISHLTLTQASARRAAIQIRSGSGSCQAGTTITGDVVLGAGALTVTNDCTIDGSLYMTGAGGLNSSGHVTGDLYSAGVASGYSVKIDTSTAKVDGTVYAAGPVLNRGRIGHDVVAGPTAGASTFASGSSVGGSVVVAGTALVNTGTVVGAVQTGRSGIVTPVIPTVPPWVNFPYDATKWVTDAGAQFSVTTLASGDCDLNGTGSAATKLAQAAALGTPAILDARNCGTVTIYNQDLLLKNDLVVVTNGFSMGQVRFNSATTGDKRVWILIPDEAVESPAAPTCAGRSASITNDLTIGPTVSAMLYSPCTVTNSGNYWRGQMYASSVVSNSDFIFNYLPLGLPGVNLDLGTLTPPPAGTGSLGDRISVRDLTAG